MARVSRATTIAVRDTCICLHAQRAARVLGRRFDHALRPLRLTNGQFSLLLAVNRPAARDAGDAATFTALAELLGMDRTTLTSNLKPLARRRLVRVRDDAHDRRVRRVALTAAGSALLVAAVPIWRRAHAAVERVLAPDAKRMRASLVAIAALGARDAR